MKNSVSKTSGVVKALKGAELASRRRKLGASWRVSEGRRLKRDFEFKDFKRALTFTNRVGALAEKVQHHPDIALGWGKADITLWTHSAGGLTEADFALAAKIGKLKK